MCLYFVMNPFEKKRTCCQWIMIDYNEINISAECVETHSDRTQLKEKLANTSDSDLFCLN